jgi:CRP/FNR family transcriptional regulator, anaerobic regulatory protein
VAALLLTRARVHNPIPVTHQEIAAELGSSREVISRIVEALARRGLVRSARGMIEVLDLEALQAHAAA